MKCNGTLKSYVITLIAIGVNQQDLVKNDNNLWKLLSRCFLFKPVRKREQASTEGRCSGLGLRVGRRDASRNQRGEGHR